MRNTKLLLLLMATTTIGAFAANNGVRQVRYSPFDKKSYLTAAQIAFVRPGLDLQVQDISVGEDRRVTVEYTVADDRGLPLDLNGVFTPGPISPRYLLAYLPGDGDHYVNYNNRNVTSPITNMSALQPTTDSGGTLTTVEQGRYRYTFRNPLPQGDDPNATHTVGIYSSCDL